MVSKRDNCDSQEILQELSQAVRQQRERNLLHEHRNSVAKKLAAGVSSDAIVSHLEKCGIAESSALRLVADAERDLDQDRPSKRELRQAFDRRLMVRGAAITAVAVVAGALFLATEARTGGSAIFAKAMLIGGFVGPVVFLSGLVGWLIDRIRPPL